ncbi:MAG: hypothetical protein L0216_20620 [Planctomycetales bacterium]|nr:hypothetical protein [Planctomycetales bacterium]
MATVTVLGALLVAGAARAEQDLGEAARGKAVETILLKIEAEELEPGLTAAQLFAEAPRLRQAAEEAAWAKAREAPATRLGDGRYAVDVKLPGDYLRDRLEAARPTAALRPARRAVSFDRLATGGLSFAARGEAAPSASSPPAAPRSGAAPVPPVWGSVSEPDRRRAAAAARAKALERAVDLLVMPAGTLEGARLFADAARQSLGLELRRNEAGLVRLGVRFEEPQYRDDRVCAVTVVLHPEALFAVLEAGVRGVRREAISAIRERIGRTPARATGEAPPPETGRAPEWPRVLHADGEASPESGADDPGASAHERAVVRARKGLLEELLRLRHRVHGHLGTLAEKDSALRERLDRFVRDQAREAPTAAAGGAGRKRVHLELLTDGLEKVLEGK